MKSKLLILLTFVSTLVTAQDCDLTFRGSVVDLHDNSPLSGATIVVAGPEKAVVSDFDGNFVVENLCQETYNLQISHPECTTRVFTITLSENSTRTFRLEHHLEELNQVIVTGSSYITKTESLLENRLDTELLESYSNASLGDALKTISGVSTLTTGNAVVKPVINGLHSSRITIVNNGVRQQDQEWGAEHAPNLDLNSAGSITVLKGASALQFSGDAIGGVVVSEPSPVPILDSLYGKTILTAQTNGRGAALTSTLTKSYESGVYARVQGTVKGYGDFEAPDYILSNTGVNERDVSISLGLNKLKYGIEGYYSYFESTLGILRASHIGGAQDQVAAINSERPLIIRDFTYDIDVPRQEVSHHLGKIAAFVKFDRLGKVSLQYDVQQNNRFEFDVRRTDDDRPAVDLQLTTHNVMVDLESELTDKINTKIGVVGNYQENFPNPATGVRRLIPDYEQYKVGAFVIADMEVSDRLTAEIGARLDHTFMDVFKFYRTSFWESRGYDVLFPNLVVEEFDNQILTNPELDFTNVSATTGISYKLNDAYMLFANYSLASRAPNASELFSEGLHHSASRIELGDLRFTSETAQKFTLALQKKGENFSFSVNPYANFISDFIVIEPTGIQQTIRGNFQVWEYRQTEARMLGIDTDLNWNIWEDVLYSNQFSLVKGWDQTRNTALINMPPASIRNAIDYTLPFQHPLSVGLESNLVLEQNEFPDNNFEVFIPETETLELVDISTPPEAYHLMGLRISTQFELGGDKALDLNLKVTNLLNTSYRDYLNRLRYYADDLGRNVSLQLKFNY